MRHAARGCRETDYMLVGEFRVARAVQARAGPTSIRNGDVVTAVRGRLKTANRAAMAAGAGPNVDLHRQDLACHIGKPQERNLRVGNRP